jgi:tetratricopeptide (TPR) repeat protein
MASKAGIYQSEGNLQEAAKSLPEINCQTSPQVAFDVKIDQLRLERNYVEAVGLLQARLAQFRYATRRDKGFEQVTLALIQRLAGDTAGAKVTAEQARDTLEPLYRDQPDDWATATSLSQAYAVMGDKDLARKLAERAITILPRGKDAVNGPGLEENLALIRTMFGENNRAISTLTQLLQTSYTSGFEPWVITPAILRLDSRWDPLRGDPAFQKLCEEKQP